MYMEEQRCFETPPPPSKKKVVLCYYRFKTWHMLWRELPCCYTHPQKDSSMSITEQSGTSSLNQNPVQPDPTGESLQEG